MNAKNFSQSFEPPITTDKSHLQIDGQQKVLGEKTKPIFKGLKNLDPLRRVPSSHIMSSHDF